MCMRACVMKLRKIQPVCISGITQMIELIFGMETKPDYPFHRFFVEIDSRIELL